MADMEDHTLEKILLGVYKLFHETHCTSNSYHDPANISRRFLTNSWHIL